MNRDEIRAQAREVLIEATLLEAQIESRHQTRARTFRIVRSTAINVTGLVLALPTGGLSVLLCVAGLWDLFDTLGEDARNMNEQNAIRRRVRVLRNRLSELEGELDKETPDGN